MTGGRQPVLLNGTNGTGNNGNIEESGPNNRPFPSVFMSPLGVARGVLFPNAHTILPTSCPLPRGVQRGTAYFLVNDLDSHKIKKDFYGVQFANRGVHIRLLLRVGVKNRPWQPSSIHSIRRINTLCQRYRCV